MRLIFRQIVCACTLLIVLLACNSINFIYREVPTKYVRFIDVGNIVSKFQNITPVVSYLPKNYVKTGTVDYTKYIQKAIDNNSIVLMPNFPVLINDQGIKVKDSSVLIFDKKSMLVLKPSHLQGYEIVKVSNNTDVTIISPVIKGDRAEHNGGAGEWGMGLSIKNSRNVKIYNPMISDCWGDGIYIGGNEPSENVNIVGGLINNNRRNGISVINGKQVILEDIVVANSNGTSPQTGIDVEPNSDKDRVEELEIHSIISFNNGTSGLTFNLGRLKSKKFSNSVRINVSGFQDIYSNSGICYSNMKSTSLNALTGLISLSDINLSFNKTPLKFLYNNSSLDKIKLSFKEVRVDSNINAAILSDLKQFQKKGFRLNGK